MKRSELEPDKKFGKLSKGVQRRLAFALAAATGSELLLDEPTAGVDPFARWELLENISCFMQDGDRTIVFATHVIEEVRRVADYAVFHLDGNFLGLYEKDALLEQRKTLWVDREPVGDALGVVEVQGGCPTHIVFDSPREAGEGPSAKNIRIIRSGTLDLEEMLSHLMRRSKQGRGARAAMDPNHRKGDRHM